VVEGRPELADFLEPNWTNVHNNKMTHPDLVIKYGRNEVNWDLPTRFKIQISAYLQAFYLMSIVIIYKHFNVWQGEL